MESKVYGKLCSLFYDATKNYAPQKEVDFYASFLGTNQGRILEAMAGSGRLLIPLLQREFIVDGVDNSEIMLERCRERCTQLKLTAELYLQSLEQLALPHRYSLVTIAVGSFQLIINREKALQALKNIHVHMQPDGNLLIDIFIPDRSDQETQMRIARIDQRSVIRLKTRSVFDEHQRIGNAFCFYELIVDGEVQEREDEMLQVTWYTDEEFIELLSQAGFKVIKIYTESFRSAGPSRIVHAQPLT